jgi:hypothetical protein
MALAGPRRPEYAMRSCGLGSGRDKMRRPSFKIVVPVLLLAVAGGATWFFAFRRAPACSGGASYMSTVGQCRAYGLDAAICEKAVEKARAIADRSAPKTEALFDCEVAYSECFQTPDGRFAPTPSFCLGSAGAAEPTEVRYLRYESDRLNRRKTREVRIH